MLLLPAHETMDGRPLYTRLKEIEDTFSCRSSLPLGVDFSWGLWVIFSPTDCYIRCPLAYLVPPNFLPPLVSEDQICHVIPSSMSTQISLIEHHNPPNNHGSKRENRWTQPISSRTEVHKLARYLVVSCTVVLRMQHELANCWRSFNSPHSTLDKNYKFRALPPCSAPNIARPSVSFRSMYQHLISNLENPCNTYAPRNPRH